MSNFTRTIYGGIAACLIGLPAAYAKYCIQLPSCQELGYIYPYERYSKNRIVKCPFDSHYVMLLDYCQAYPFTERDKSEKNLSDRGVLQQCTVYKADDQDKAVAAPYYRYIRCNQGYTYTSGDCVRKVGNPYIYNDIAIGLIYYIDNSIIKVVGLTDIDADGNPDSTAKLPWSRLQASGVSTDSVSYDVSSLANKTTTSSRDLDTNGYSNTNYIVSYITPKGYQAQAAQATRSYAPTGCSVTSLCGSGKWSLPAFGELKLINNIETQLAAADASMADPHWSSTEAGTTAWVYNNSTAVAKYNTYAVRPVIYFSNN